jgi:hypothetical protein
MDIPWIYLMDIHGISKDIPCISMDIVEDYIYMVYTRHIPGIYRKSGFQMSGPATGRPAAHWHYGRAGFPPDRRRS